MNKKGKIMPKLLLVDIVIFGGNGNLALHKIMPALYYLFSQGYIDDNSRIFSIDRSDITDEHHKERVYSALIKHLPENHCSPSHWQSFASRLFRINMDVTSPKNYANLVKQLNESSKHERVYYLSTSSSLFGDICTTLNQTGLINSNSRVVLEKPIGHSLESFKKIDDLVGSVFPENHIFRIDHYLGKDTVQNILALRFSNALFMPIWNNKNIDNIQITVAEKIGINGRYNYYDKYGAMRDMIQNHLLQLLCLVTMEPPVNLESDNLHNEKVKVLRSLRKITKEDIAKKTVWGQYEQGSIDGVVVPGYCQDGGQDATSATETFVAIRADIDNWTWSGVPFYLRTGKRMSAQFSEIIIQFKQTPHSIFSNSKQAIEPNRLVINLQPEESIKLSLMNKTPGLSKSIELHTVELELNKTENNPRSPTAYERLLLDVINNDLALFMRRDEVEAAWGWADSILNNWDKKDNKVKSYAAGVDGPEASINLLKQDGRSWYSQP